LISIFVYPTVTTKSPITVTTPPVIILSSDTLDFKTAIQPIFEKHCNPCHFPGGKMYEKMPFDNPKTILDHEAGILRRIKDAEENEQIREFVKRSKS
jgi:hypothetical protein